MNTLACTGPDAKFWTSGIPEETAEAITACGFCAVRPSCLRLALSLQPTAGVFGGRLFTDNNEIATP